MTTTPMTRDQVVKVVAKARAGGQTPDLGGADLRGAYLGGAYLGGAYLRGADLGGAYLRGADLRGADLAGADLAGADLAGAYLGYALVLQLGPLGSRRDYLVVVASKTTHECRAGCWRGTVDALETRVAEVHGDNSYGQEYRAAIAHVRAWLALSTPQAGA